jgi:hypothetical protein
MRPGLSIDQCVDRVKRYHFALKRLMQIFQARLTSEPIYELKMAYSLHSHYCAEHVSTMRVRVSEMRTPPLGLEKIPDEHLDTYFHELQNAPSTEALMLGLYGHALPALLRGMHRHLVETNPLADHPTLRLLRHALLDLQEVADYGAKAIASLVDEAHRTALEPWTTLLTALLAAAGDLDGSQPRTPLALEPMHSVEAHVYQRLPARDERFPDPYNMGVHAEEFLYDPQFRPRDKTLMMYYKRLREIDVPEMMASILTETADKPWDYYRDMTRQLWDEARHAMMGEVGFVSQGLTDWPQLVMINHTWALGLNTQLPPWGRHAVLYFIEQGLMTKTGKRFEWEVGSESGDPLSKLFQDYDWADEVLHARIGKDWYVSAFGDQKEAIEYGNACWNQVLSGWHAWRDEGKTAHRNWWPALYLAFCERHAMQPDLRALAYSATYEATRADLEKFAASA